MRLQLKSRWLIIPAMLALGALIAGLYLFRHRFVRTDRDMFSLLPDGDATVFFVDVDKVRRTGMLNLLSGSKPVFEREYKAFIEQSGFNYAEDADAVVAWTDGQQLLLVLRGRFDWPKLDGYAAAHGGKCSEDICRVPSGRPGKMLSFTSIQSNVLGLALSPDSSAVKMLAPHKERSPGALPAEPAWVKLSKAVLRDPTSLPLPIRIFAISVQSADTVAILLGPAADGAAGLQLRLEADCQNVAAAETIRNQLEIQTKMLNLELARERRKPDRADLTGLLTAGSFQVLSRRVLGYWPLREELLKSLE